MRAPREPRQPWERLYELGDTVVVNAEALVFY